MEEVSNLTPFQMSYWKRLAKKFSVAIGYKFAFLIAAIAGAFHFELAYKSFNDSLTNAVFNSLLGVVAIWLVVRFFIKYIKSLNQAYDSIDF